MRFVLPLLALCALSSAPLRADLLNITLSGNPGSLSGNGTFSTDGICSVCFAGLGLLDLTINIGPDSGMNAFDISDDSLAIAAYDRPLNALVYSGTNSETGDILSMFGGTWGLLRGTLVDSGTYFVTPTPEPRSLFLLMSIVALVGLRWRHQRHRA